MVMLWGVWRGWFSGLTPSGYGRISPQHGFSAGLFWGAIVAPGVYFLVIDGLIKYVPVRLQQLALAPAVPAIIAFALALALSITAHRPWASGHYVARRLSSGVWWSIAGVAAAVIGIWLLSNACAHREAVRDATTRLCPFCAEPVRAAAVLCKHCRSPIEPTAAAREPAIMEQRT